MHFGINERYGHAARLYAWFIPDIRLMQTIQPPWSIQDMRKALLGRGTTATKLSEGDAGLYGQVMIFEHVKSFWDPCRSERFICALLKCRIDHLNNAPTGSSLRTDRV